MSASRLVFAVGLLSGLVSLAVVLFSVGLAIQQGAPEVIGRALQSLMAGEAGAQCQAAGGWRSEVNGDLVALLDPATAATDPRVPAQVRDAVRGGTLPFLGRTEAGPAIAVRTGRVGPCEIYMHRWTRDQRSRWIVRIAVPAAAAATLLGLLGAWLTVRPLRRRLTVLADAAGQVGAQAGYPGADVGGRDDLTRVGHALDAAHARIADDHARLVAQQSALEDDLSTLAHDTNTPLTSLFMALESISTQAETPAIQADADAALADVVYLASLVQNLALDRRFAGALPAAPEAPFDLGAVVAQVAQRAERLGRRGRVAVDGAWPDDAVWVHGHDTLAQQALMNVVQNAVEAAPEGGQVLVVLEASAAGFLLWVADDGPGVAAEAMPHLTERGWRGPQTRTDRPHGSGLGLATTQAVCARLGWTLTFDGRGSQAGLEVRMTGPIAPSR